MNQHRPTPSPAPAQPELHTRNSDGTVPSTNLPTGWLGELHYWGLVVLLTLVFTSLLALCAGYVISR